MSLCSIRRAEEQVRLFGNAESIAAIYKKLQALDNTGSEINNLLLILDKESLKKDIIQNSHAYILPHVYERGDKPLWCHQRFNNERCHQSQGEDDSGRRGKLLGES